MALSIVGKYVHSSMWKQSYNVTFHFLCLKVTKIVVFIPFGISLFWHHIYSCSRESMHAHVHKHPCKVHKLLFPSRLKNTSSFSQDTCQVIGTTETTSFNVMHGRLVQVGVGWMKILRCLCLWLWRRRFQISEIIVVSKVHSIPPQNPPNK